MAFELREIENLGFADLQELRDSKVPESKVLDYKRALSFANKDIREFLADVSSFANTAGGHLLIGVQEESGFPTDFPGVKLDDPDAEKQKLTNFIRDGISPRIPGVSIHNIPLENSKYVIVIHIPRSWIAPHVVIFDKHWRFYGRHSSGKYPLDVPELRQAFLLTETLADKMKNFRTERLGKIIANELPVEMLNNPKIVLHIIPLSAFSLPSYGVFSFPPDNSNLSPINHRGYTSRINFEGLLVFTPAGGHANATTYTQLYRNGIIEAVESNLLRLERDDQYAFLIPPISFGEKIIHAVQRFLCQLGKMGVEPPALVMLSLLNVKGWGISSGDFGAGGDKIDRDYLILPDVLVEDFNLEADIIMKPIFDTLWNAAGHEKSQGYNEEGRWVGSRR